MQVIVMWIYIAWNIVSAVLLLNLLVGQTHDIRENKKKIGARRIFHCPSTASFYIVTSLILSPRAAMMSRTYSDDAEDTHRQPPKYSFLHQFQMAANIM